MDPNQLNQQSTIVATDSAPPQQTLMGVTAPISEGLDLAAIRQSFDEVLQRLDRLSESFESKLQYDQAKDKQIDFLDGELKQAREGLFLRILRPIFLSLISLYDMIGQGREVALREVGGAENATTRNYESYQAEVEEILMRSGVILFQSSPGSPYHAASQQVVQVQNVSDQTLNGTITASRRPGFKFEDKVLRPEWVVVYQYAAGS